MSDEKRDALERRFRRGTVDLRDDADSDALPKLRGYAAVFNQETLIGSPDWGFREQIAPGAFSVAIRQDDVRALFNHDDNQVLGRTKSGTLRLVEDETGLYYVIDPPDTVIGRDVVQLVSRGDVDGSSFSFRVIEDQWEYPADPKTPARPLRTVLKVELFDVSPVTYPAYPQTSVSARAKELASAATETRAASSQEKPMASKSKTYAACSRCGLHKRVKVKRGGATVCKKCRKAKRAAKKAKRAARAAMAVTHNPLNARVVNDGAGLPGVVYGALDPDHFGRGPGVGCAIGGRHGNPPARPRRERPICGIGVFQSMTDGQPIETPAAYRSFERLSRPPSMASRAW